MDNQLAVGIQQESRFLSPAATIAQAIARYALMAEFIKQVMHKDTDYGVIPGTDKPTLLKPGAEKLNSLFGLTPMFEREDTVLDITGAHYDGEPFIYFQYKCIIWNGDNRIAEGLGSCNSWEKKYRYRNADRKCPTCGKTTIIKGKAEYGGGYICFAKKGGCGAKFSETDPAITGQQLGQIKNPDISDLINTLDKMAQKRALVAATLIATNASDYFTQDLDDTDLGSGTVVDAKVHDVPPDPTEQQEEHHNGNGKEAINPKLQALIDAKVSPDVPDAAGVMNLIKGASLTVEEVVARGKLYRRWRDEAGATTKQAAEKAIAGQAPS